MFRQTQQLPLLATSLYPPWHGEFHSPIMPHSTYPSGNLALLLKMAIEIVDLPINNCEFP